MDFLKRNWRTILAVLIIIVLSYVENEKFSEGTGVEGNSRKAMHLVFLFAIQLTGYLYWLKSPFGWMKHMWAFSYIGIFFVLISVGVLNWKFQLFTTEFLDQIRVLRTFFSSPLPFIGSIVISEIYARNAVLAAKELKVK